MKLAVSRWIAILLFAAGLFMALLFDWVLGALIFSSGVVVLGSGSMVEDRAVGVVLIVVGVGAMAGILGHLVTGVGP